MDFVSNSVTMKKKQLLLSVVIPLALGVFSVTSANTDIIVTGGSWVWTYHLPNVESVEIGYRKTECEEFCLFFYFFCSYCRDEYFTLQLDSEAGRLSTLRESVKCGTGGWSLIRVLEKYILSDNIRYDVKSGGREQPLRGRTLRISSKYPLEWKFFSVIPKPTYNFTGNLEAADLNPITPMSMMVIGGSVSGSLVFVLIVIITVLLRNRKKQLNPETTNDAGQENADHSYVDVTNVNDHIYDDVENVVENIYENPDYSRYC